MGLSVASVRHYGTLDQGTTSRAAGSIAASNKRHAFCNRWANGRTGSINTNKIMRMLRHLLYSQRNASTASRSTCRVNRAVSA